MVKINLKAILLGWTNRFKYDKLPQYQQEIFSDRMSVCKSNRCGKYKFKICTACGCPVSAKTKVLSELCPENMWNPTVYNYGDVQFIVLSAAPPTLKKKFLLAGSHRFAHEEGLPWDGILLDEWTDFLKSIEQ